MAGDFREAFQSTGNVAAYDEGQYAPGGYWDVLWQIEKEILDSVMARLRTTKTVVRHLDFACGTGRILAHLEPSCDESVGIDVSQVMLDVARTRVRAARLLRVDIAAGEAADEGGFDLVTAFRFVLNAEPSLRQAALKELVGRLRDRDSLLVVNNHGSLWSYKAALAPLKALRDRVTGGRPERLLSTRRMDTLLRDAGLDVLGQHGLGLLPGAVLERVPDKWRASVERSLRRLPGLASLGVNQIYVCRKAA